MGDITSSMSSSGRALVSSKLSSHFTFWNSVGCFEVRIRIKNRELGFLELDWMAGEFGVL